MEKQISTLFIILTFGILSCKEDKGISSSAVCGDEASANIFAPTMKIFTDMEFQDNNYHRYTVYDTTNNPKFSIFRLILDLKKVCKDDLPTITASLSLNHADTSVSIRMVTEVNNGPIVEFTPQPDGLLYQRSENLDLNSTIDPTDVQITCFFGFPKQGSFSADSLYYDQLVSNFYISAVYHPPL